LGIDTPQSLLEEQHRDVEGALWAAGRTVRERAALLRRARAGRERSPRTVSTRRPIF